MPKGVMLSHGNLIANIMGVYAVGKDVSMTNSLQIEFVFFSKRNDFCYL